MNAACSGLKKKMSRSDLCWTFASFLFLKFSLPFLERQYFQRERIILERQFLQPEQNLWCPTCNPAFHVWGFNGFLVSNACKIQSVDSWVQWKSRTWNATRKDVILAEETRQFVYLCELSMFRHVKTRSPKLTSHFSRKLGQFHWKLAKFWQTLGLLPNQRKALVNVKLGIQKKAFVNPRVQTHVHHQVHPPEALITCTHKRGKADFWLPKEWQFSPLPKRILVWSSNGILGGILGYFALNWLCTKRNSSMKSGSALRAMIPQVTHRWLRLSTKVAIFWRHCIDYQGLWSLNNIRADLERATPTITWSTPQTYIVLLREVEKKCGCNQCTHKTWPLTFMFEEIARRSL